MPRKPLLFNGPGLREGYKLDTIEIAPNAEIKATKTVNLDEWIIAVGKSTQEDQTPDGSNQDAESFTLTQEAAVSWTQFQREQTQLAFTFA